MLRTLAFIGFLLFVGNCAIAGDAVKKNSGTSASASPIGSASPQDYLVRGLKEALAKGVAQSITNLSREGGYLQNIKVKIQMPEKLVPVERTLRAMKQDHLVDEFITNMNHAAELAVREVGPIFSQALENLTLQDVQPLLKGPDDAATQYFRKSSEKKLQEKMLPIIQKTTESAGATASYKKLMEKVSLGTSLLKLKQAPVDLDTYVTQKATDGLFAMIAEEEKRIRQNPAARTSDLLQRVFGRN